MKRSNRVFVAGGSGTAGRAYSLALAAHGYEVVATARDEDGTRALADSGVEPIALDLADADATAEAIDGSGVVVVSVLGRGEQGAAEEEAITRNVIDAAARAGISRLIYTSVHGADRRTGVPHFEVKGRLERYLASTDVLATVLRPCTFTEALSAPWIRDGLVSRGVLASPITIDTPISYVAATDLAEVAVRTLAEPDLADKTIELGGPRAVTYLELIPLLSKLVGRSVRYENVPLEVVESEVGSDVAAMVGFFNREGFVAELDPVVWRLGLALRSVEEFLETAFASASAVGEGSA